MGGIAANQSSDTSKAYQLAVLVLLQSNGPEQGGGRPIVGSDAGIQADGDHQGIDLADGVAHTHVSMITVFGPDRFTPGLQIGLQEARADSKSQQGPGSGLRNANANVNASSALMPCNTACIPARIDRNSASRNRLRAAVRSMAMAPAPLPR